MSKRQKTFVRNVSKSGNGTMVRVHQDELRAIAVDVGAPVRVTIEPVDDRYEATRASAKRMRGRFARTLDLLGK